MATTTALLGRITDVIELRGLDVEDPAAQHAQAICDDRFAQDCPPRYRGRSDLHGATCSRPNRHLGWHIATETGRTCDAVLAWKRQGDIA